MNVGSLFSGIGGFDLGLERAGMTVKWQCEIDRAAQGVLRRRFPAATIYDDVTMIGDDVERVGLICGGFPCQDLSVAGRRAGLAGERSGLWYEFHRILAELTPRWCIIENVPGLLSSQGGADFAVVLRGLVELGYGVAWRVLDAQYFGVAQRRRRVFIVGCLGDRRSAAEVLFEPESLPGNPAPCREAGTRVTQSLTGGPSSSSCGNPDDNRAQGGFITVAHALGAPATGGARLDPNGEDLIVTHALTAEGHDASEDGSGRGTPLVATAFSAVNSADAYGIALTEEGTPPLRAAESGTNQVPSVQYGTAVRRLTPTECERLQGFPDGWTDGQSDSARYRQLGNAVCVPVAEWIGKRIMEVSL